VVLVEATASAFSVFSRTHFVYTSTSRDSVAEYGAHTFCVSYVGHASPTDHVLDDCNSPNALYEDRIQVTRFRTPPGLQMSFEYAAKVSLPLLVTRRVLLT
jgi:hypothetical protein